MSKYIVTNMGTTPELTGDTNVYDGENIYDVFRDNDLVDEDTLNEDIDNIIEEFYRVMEV